MGAFALFQDEPDEDSGPELFQDEKDEGENFLFQDEPPERGDQGGPSPSNPSIQSKDHGLSVLRDEPEESPLQPALFGTEGDEVKSDSGSDGSAYFGDCEKEKSDNHAIVQLNFATIKVSVFAVEQGRNRTTGQGTCQEEETLQQPEPGKTC